MPRSGVRSSSSPPFLAALEKSPLNGSTVEPRNLRPIKTRSRQSDDIRSRFALAAFHDGREQCGKQHSRRGAAVKSACDVLRTDLGVQRVCRPCQIEIRVQKHAAEDQRSPGQHLQLRAAREEPVFQRRVSGVAIGRASHPIRQIPTTFSTRSSIGNLTSKAESRATATT